MKGTNRDADLARPTSRAIAREGDGVEGRTGGDEIGGWRTCAWYRRAEGLETRVERWIGGLAHGAREWAACGVV
ncbi:hypothetical protein Ade02nite_75790 [Paractinoplanes deccanensis]|uniref:Uncharacterized protein n=1 Tax=Paractinoplanes deccanensis TaxID=113561 RepID=A0ABQ3YFZ1_9ACTN|nr:hypothetical protein Ade02nite_75790 [Actinoplanes deccanensis]